LISVAPASGYNGIVNLSVPSGCPVSSSNCTISPGQADFSASTTPVPATLTVAGAGTSAQNYSIVVKGTDSTNTSLTSQTSVQLAVTDFSLSSNPSSQTVTAGTNAQYTITANALNGFSGSVGLSVGSTCPSGLTCTLGSYSISAGSSTTLTVSGTSSVTTTTNFSITVTGTSSGLTRQVTVGLTVNPPAAGNFSISASPGTLTLKSGQSGSYTVTITPLSGFAGAVGLGVSGCPSKAVCSFSSSTVTISGGTAASSLLKITDNGVPRGSASLTITGTSAANPTLSHSVSVVLKTH
jgi:serine protease AprX